MAARLTIVPELLIKNLTALPTEKQDENFENLKTHSPGAAYLCEKILFPLSRGEKLNTRELDMSAFSVTDIPKVAEYYDEHFSYDCDENEQLVYFCKKLCEKVPLAQKTEFI